jgi:hypothetical protein
LRPNPVRNQGVKTSTLVNFVEMWESVAFVEYPGRASLIERWTIYVIQQSFREIGRGRKVLESLLILNADRGPTEPVGHAQHGDVHAALI